MFERPHLARHDRSTGPDHESAIARRREASAGKAGIHISETTRVPAVLCQHPAQPRQPIELRLRSRQAHDAGQQQCEHGTNSTRAGWPEEEGASA